jgi:hypothetical protein
MDLIDFDVKKIKNITSKKLNGNGIQDGRQTIFLV